MCTWAHTDQSALEVSGTRCPHLYYLEAVKNISICLSLRGHIAGPLGEDWLAGAGRDQEMVPSAEGIVDAVCSDHLRQGRVAAV